MNADKAPSAAPFDQRLTLMTIFAVDLLRSLQNHPDSASYTIPAIDIGVTTAPYYSDKSLAITDSPEGQKWYPSKPQHIHLIGFDTLTRFFAPKYYQSFSPPLSALAPYFEADHRLRATLRPDDAYGSEAEQRAFVQNLAHGGLEAEGGKREWAECVELVNATPKAGVSSTVIRKAAKAGEWGVVGELCTEGVAEWVREEGLYEDDAEGKKMG
jgi:nicotinamide-nucleotide adenylyltransferase